METRKRQQNELQAKFKQDKGSEVERSAHSGIRLCSAHVNNRIRAILISGFHGNATVFAVCQLRVGFCT